MKAYVIVKDIDSKFEAVVASKKQAVEYLVAVAQAVMLTDDITKRIDITCDSIRITEMGTTTDYYVLETELNDMYKNPSSITEKLLAKIQLALDDIGVEYNEMF